MLIPFTLLVLFPISYLNTSNVNVNLISYWIISFNGLDLNTSNVNFNLNDKFFTFSFNKI